MDHTKLQILLEAFPDHRLVAFLENVKREENFGQQNHPQGKQRNLRRRIHSDNSFGDLRRKAKVERVKGKAEAWNLPHPSTFAFLPCPFALSRLPIGRLHQHRSNSE